MSTYIVEYEYYRVQICVDFNSVLAARDARMYVW